MMTFKRAHVATAMILTSVRWAVAHPLCDGSIDEYGFTATECPIVEWLSVPILECTRWRAVGIDVGAIEVGDDNVWRFSEDIKQDLGCSSGDRASETVGVCFKPACGGQLRPCAPVGDAGRSLIAAVRAGEDHW